MMNRQPYFLRIYFLIFILAVGFGGIIWRIFYLGTIKKEFLEQQSAARSLRVIDIPAHRGMITDRNGLPLAISTPAAAIWVSPVLYDATPEQEFQLAKILKVTNAFLKNKITQEKGHTFVYLKRHLPPEQAELVKALGIPGIFTQREYQRYYPEGEVTAQLLGFTNVDESGVEGLELTYDQWLRGVAGRKEVAKDRLGRVVNELRVITEPQPGHNLALSIDRNIQYLAYKELQNAVDKYRATSGSAIVLDVQSGEILAMVNQPSYNPNGHMEKRTAGFRNRAVTDVFEPGSTAKTFSIVSALESGKYHPWTKINTSPGWWYVDGNKVTDREVRDMDYGVLTVAGVLQKSSNVGVSKITLSLPSDNLLSVLQRFGFGESTYSGFPGEVGGHLPDNLRNRPFVLATLAFGYSISVTPLQLVRAYAALATGGILSGITFLKNGGGTLLKRRILSQKIAIDTLNMLEMVLGSGGTGQKGQVAGYKVAGKTGTAYMTGVKGYEKHSYHSAFVGVAPVSAPRLAIVVVLQNPQGEHFGGLVAAPVFANIMAGALRTLNVPPDNL